MKLQVPVPNTLFRIGLLLMIVKAYSSYSSIIEVSDSVDMALSLVACLFFAGSIMQKQYCTKTWVSFFLIVMLTLFTSWKTGNLMMFITVVTCLAMCGEDVDKTIRFLLFWETAYILVTVVISVVMHTCGISMLTLVGKELRYNFGFSHPNVFACIATNLIAMYLWLNFNSVRIYQIFSISAVTLVIYLLSGSRTALIIVVFLIVFVVLFRNAPPKNRLLRAGAAITAPTLSCFFYICVRKYTSGNKLIQLLDTALSKRIKLGAYGYNHYGISFFGQNLGDMKIKWDPYWRLTTFTFDNMYTQLMVTQLFWLIVICLLLYRLALRADTKRCIFILTWALYGISEIHVINPYLFFVILLVTELFDETRYSMRKKENTENRQENKEESHDY